MHFKSQACILKVSHCGIVPVRQCALAGDFDQTRHWRSCFKAMKAMEWYLPCQKAGFREWWHGKVWCGADQAKK